MPTYQPTTTNVTVIVENIHPTISSIINIILGSLICVTGFFGNLAIVTIIFRKKQMQTPTNWFVFNLSISNLVIVVTSIPSNLIYPYIDWPFGSVGCQYLVMPVMEHFASVCVLTHTAISVARYTIIQNSGNRRRLTRKITRWTIFLIWVLSFLVLSVTLMGILGEFRLKRVGKGTLECRLIWLSDMHGHVYRILVFIITYVIPMLTTGYSYIRIHYILQRNLNENNNALSDDDVLARRRYNRQVDVMLMTMYVFFAGTTLPLQLFLFLNNFKLLGRMKNANAKVIFDYLLCLYYAQILTHPLVLLYMGEQYRKELKRLVSCFRFFLPKIQNISVILRGNMKMHLNSRGLQVPFDHNTSEINRQEPKSNNEDQPASTPQRSKFVPLNINSDIPVSSLSHRTGTKKRNEKFTITRKNSKPETLNFIPDKDICDCVVESSNQKSCEHHKGCMTSTNALNEEMMNKNTVDHMLFESSEKFENLLVRLQNGEAERETIL